MFKKLCLVLSLSLLAGLAAAGNITPEETQKQNEFRKLMGSPDKADHLKAVQTLAGGTHESTMQLLLAVIKVDQFADVRAAAFKTLAQMPARDNRLAITLAGVFRELKSNDFDARYAFAEAFKSSEFKVPVYEALVEWSGKLRYPDPVTGYNSNNNGNASGQGGLVGGDPNQGIKKQRAEFEKFAKLFNEITKANVSATDKDSPQMPKKWWNENRAKIEAADKELADKFRAEDMAAQNKSNPLIGGKAADKPAEKPADKKKDE